jgi:hypothetical protein
LKAAINEFTPGFEPEELAASQTFDAEPIQKID